MKQFTAFILTGLMAAALCGAQTMASSGIFRQEGIASWYGSEFDGRPTASGEIFRSGLYTAAHPTLPFGSQLLITNTHNNKQVVVRVNDRGPFVPARIIDLSRAAAEKLDMIITGTAPVTVEFTSMPVGYYGQIDGLVADPAPAQTLPPVSQQLPSSAPTAAPVYQALPPPQVSPASSAPAQVYQSAPAPQPEPAIPAYRPELSRTATSITPALPVPGSGKLYRIQVGSYRVARNAVEAFDRLKNAGLSPIYEKTGDLYRVILSGLRPEDVPLVAERLGTAGFPEGLIREEL